MKLLLGLLFIVAAVGGVVLAKPKDGKLRWFVNTSLEVPLVISIIAVLALGVVLGVQGVTEFTARTPG
jgi:hypothetical protein